MLMERSVKDLHDNGIRQTKSPYGVAETIQRLEVVLAQKGIPVLAHIHHSAAAIAAGMAMKPTELLIFGNAKAGTPLMLAAPSAALDLPLKALVWEDGNGDVWVSYNTPEYLQQRHGFPQALIANIAGLRVIVEQATQS
jgi:uncharacterized protein (DUF302 family)